MAWIKRNLIFVIAAIVGVLLTGYCAYVLYSAMQKNQTVHDDYTQTVTDLNQERQKKPFPNDQNIKAAKEDQSRVQAFLGNFRKAFAPFPPPPTKDARGFKEYLQRTIYQWGVEATNANVLLPPEYYFTWTAQNEQLNFQPECIGPWMQQIEEENTILHILFDAHISYLEYIRRVATACDDNPGSDCISGVNSVTNAWGVVTPYVIGFRGFSTELAGVLEGFAASSNCFIVKVVTVTPSRAPLPQVITPPPAAAAPPPQQMPMYRQPYFLPGQGGMGRGGGSRGGGFFPQYRPQPVPEEVAPAAPAAPVTILTENPLYITIALDVVKLK